MKKSPYWVNNVYSLGYWLKDLGYYPQQWPLYNYMDHGITLFDSIPPHEIDNDAPVMFKFSKRLVKAYKQVSDKPVFCVRNPTVHCRHKLGIGQLPGATGTLFFPSHSTQHIDNKMNWDLLVNQVKQLPAGFHPVHMCLHPSDVKKGLKEYFEQQGFKVFCAGEVEDNKFAENFYNILKAYKFSMSNLIGSYTFYSVEMKIPFSLYGNEPVYFNNGDSNVETGAFTSYKDHPAFKYAIRLFTGLHTSIGEEQLKFVNEELGIGTSISRLRLAFILRRIYLVKQFKNNTHFKRIKQITAKNNNPS